VRTTETQTEEGIFCHQKSKEWKEKKKKMMKRRKRPFQSQMLGIPTMDGVLQIPKKELGQMLPVGMKKGHFQLSKCSIQKSLTNTIITTSFK
jgi:hypothetical protein